MIITPNYNEIFQRFEDNSDPEKAVKMSAYMRNQFPFLGLATPLRRSLSKNFLMEAKTMARVDFRFVKECWTKPPREYQYLAVSYLHAVRDLLVPTDMPSLKQCAVSKSWWDTIDGLDRIIGHVAMRFPKINEVLLQWSLDDNFWLRRIAIDHQLTRKEKTDTGLLWRILVNNLGHEEFFVNKAIGWSLREYSKTNPEWVRGFIREFKERLSPLSVREGSKYI